jgi:hypothetical protein
VVGVAVGVLGPHDDRRRRPVGHARAVEHRQVAGDCGHGADLLDRHLATELGPLVAGAVVVVLRGDAGQHAAQLAAVDAVAVGVGRGDHREHGGGGEGAVRAVRRDGKGVEALVARVLHLLDADGHGHVVGTGRDGVRGLAQRLGPGGAHVLDPGHGLALELQRLGQHHAAHAGLRRAEPVGVDVVLGHARAREGVVGGVDEQLVDALVPVLGEAGAAHADDGDAVADAV